MRTPIVLYLSTCVLVAALVVGCAGPTQEPEIPNPASVYCEDHGGRLEIRSDAEGGQVGYCLFDDGSACEEWAYYRAECAPGDSLAQ